MHGNVIHKEIMEFKIKNLEDPKFDEEFVVDNFYFTFANGVYLHNDIEIKGSVNLKFSKSITK